MNQQEVNLQRTRIDRFEKLEARRNKIRTILQIMDAPLDTTTRMPGAFTHNTRETRLVDGVKISFSKTQGGAPATSIELYDLNISAGHFGDWVRQKLTEELNELSTLIEKL